jgi:putative DNA primase/helicase
MNNYDAVPEILKSLPNWIVWRLENRDGKPNNKSPYDAQTGHGAKANDPATWTTFEKALDAESGAVGKYEGLGFELGGTPLVGIDFDNAINAEGAVDPYVLSILHALGNPYTEKSPSGTGLHAFVFCETLPAGGRKLSRG